MRADHRSPHIAALRRFKATKFEAKLRDGTTKEFALSTKANKYELLLNLIDKLPWLTIEALDNDGKVLGIVEQDADDDEGEFVDADILSAQSIAKIVKDAVFSTLQESRKIFEVQTNGYAKMMQAVLDSQQILVETYRGAMQVQAAAVPASPEDQDKVMEMMKLGMMMMSNKPPQITANISATTPVSSGPTPKPVVVNGKKPA